MPRLRGGRAGLLSPLLLIAGILLVAALAYNLANLEPGIAGAPGPAGSGTDATERGVALSGAVVGAAVSTGSAVVLAGLVYALWKSRRRRRVVFVARPWWMWIASMAVLLVGVLLLFAWPGLQEPGEGVPDGTNDGPIPSPDVGLPTIAGAPAGLLLAVALAVNVLVLAYLLRRSSSTGRAGLGAGGAPGAEPERRAAADAVAQTIAELETGGDVRTAILACFQRFCRLLHRRGLEEQGPLTAREIEEAAVRRLGVSADHATALTSLFEEARYSVHPLDDGDRSRALTSLAAIRTRLEA